MSGIPRLVRSPNKEFSICELVDIKQTQGYCGSNHDGYKRVPDIQTYIIFY